MPGVPPLNVDYPRTVDLRALQKAYERLNALQHQLNQIPAPPTEAQAKATIGQVANEALSVGGSNPLPITSIPGASTAIPGLISGTHAARPPTNSLTAASLYFETDRTVYYQLIGNAWVFTAGVMFNSFAARPADLGTNDARFLFHAVDRALTYEWSGTTWSLLVNFQPIITDTLARWTVVNYDPARYANGQQFFLSTWQVTYTITPVRWVYTGGTYAAPFASLPATGFNGAALGPNDTGLLFYATDRKLTYQWSGSAWAIRVNFQPVIADALANWTNAGYAPGNYYAGQQFFVADWLVTYISSGSAWLYASGTYAAPAAARPVTGFNAVALGTSDTGLQFLASDTGAFEIWNGSVWVLVNGGSTAVTTPFTPQLVFGFGGSGAGITYSLQVGSSTVVGRLVTVIVNITLTSKGATTGPAYIEGLPVVPGITSTGAVVYSSMVGLVYPVAQTPIGYAFISMLNGNSTDVFNMTDANFTNGSALQIAVTYTS